MCGCIIKGFPLKTSQLEEKTAEARWACWLTMLKKAGYSLKIFASKLKNAEVSVVEMVETSFKYLICLAMLACCSCWICWLCLAYKE